MVFSKTVTLWMALVNQTVKTFTMKNEEETVDIGFFDTIF
jgi:hypothetical protein